MCRVAIRADALTRCTWLLLIAFAVGCNNDPAPTDDPVRKHFAVTIPELLVRHQVPGLAIAVVRDGELAFADGYGLANVETGRPVTPDTLFNAGSISKVVSAWGVMRLVDGGVLSLDAPVETYVSRWNLPEADFDTKAVTTRRIMSHTAGFTMHSVPGFEVPQPLPKLEAILAGDYEGSVYTNGGTPLAFFSKPGSVWRYSGGGFVLLELLVEELTLERFPEYMDREVLRPLGMTSSRFGWRDELAAKAAVPYRGNGRPYPTYRFSGVAGAGLYTSVTDLARFAAAGLTSETSQPGRDVLEPQTVESMFKRVRLADGAPAPCGLAYFLEPPDAELREAKHGGGNNGWRALMVTLPDQGKGIVILTNSDNSADLHSELVGAWRELEVDASLMKEILILLAGIVLLGCLILIALSRVGRPPKAGLLEGLLRPCPGKPNCICSEDKESAAWVEPLAFEGAPKLAWERLQAIVEEMGGTIQRRTDQYIWATFRTKVFRFVDDMEFRLAADENTIHVRSASRVGYSDLGVNNRRVQELKSRFRRSAHSGDGGDTNAPEQRPG